MKSPLCAKTHAGLLAGKCPWCGKFVTQDDTFICHDDWLDSLPTEQARGWAARFLDQLLLGNLRVTAIRRRIAERVLFFGGEFNAPELLRSLPGVSRPAVYRCLADLTALGLLEQRRSQGESWYRLVMQA